MSHKENNPIIRQMRAYELLFEAENRLRVAMHSLLVQRIGSSYSLAVTFPRFEYLLGDKKRTFDAKMHVENRRRNDREYNLEAGFEFPDFWYMDFPILGLLIKQFWDLYVKDLFVDGCNIRQELTTRMEMVSKIRNSVAHTRYISEMDLTELDGFVKILKKFQKPEYLQGYVELAFTSTDLMRQAIEKELLKVKSILEQRKIVQSKSWSTILLLIGAYKQTRGREDVPTFELDEFSDLLNKYNGLSRKPGSSATIKTFVLGSNMIDKLKNIIKWVKEL